MPQGSWLGPLAFLVLIDDFSTGCPLHKYVDDTTLSELVQPKQPDTHILTYLAELFTWAAHNGMEINTSKTKEMVLGRLANTNLPLPNISSQTVERVTTYKLLGVHIDSTLSWYTHIEYIVGFVAAAVSMPMGGCRAIRSLVVDVDVSVATELTVL